MGKNTEIKLAGQPIFNQANGHLDVFALLRSTNRNYLKQSGSPPFDNQYRLVFIIGGNF